MSSLAKCPGCSRRWRVELPAVTVIPCGTKNQGLLERSWREVYDCQCDQLYQIAEEPLLERDAWILTRARAMGWA